MARHISSLHIESFRGIKDLQINDLGAINIILGSNNCGKTSLLEAVTLLRNPDNFSNIVSVSRLREVNRFNPKFGSSFFDSFLNLFNKLSEDLLIKISAMVNGQSASLELRGKIEKVLVDLKEVMKKLFSSGMRINEDRLNESEEIDSFIGEIRLEGFHSHPTIMPDVIPVNFNKFDRTMRIVEKTFFINTTFISTFDHVTKNIFGEIVRNKSLKNSVVEILKLFDPFISDLRIIEGVDGRINQVVDNSILGYMPLSTYGDGVKKVIGLANGIVEARNGVLLVDEIETSIHTSALKKVFVWLIQACKDYNVQLFLTTHSLESVDDMLNSDDEFIEEDLIRVITLVKKEELTVARVLTGEKALQVRDDYGSELR